MNTQAVTQMERILAGAAKNLESYCSLLKLTQNVQELKPLAEEQLEDWQAVLEKRAVLIAEIETENDQISDGQRRLCSLLNLQEFDMTAAAQFLNPELVQQWTDVNDKIYTAMNQLSEADKKAREALEMWKNNMELNLHRLRKVSQMSESYQSLSMSRARFLDQRK